MITRLSGYNGIRLGIEARLSKRIDSRKLAKRVNSVLYELAWSLGIETLDESLKYVRVNPRQYDEDCTYFLELSDMRGLHPKNVMHHVPYKKVGLLANYEVERKHLNLYQTDNDEKLDPADVMHELGHGIQEMLPKRFHTDLKRKHRYILERKLLPEIRRGCDPIVAAERLLSMYAFCSRVDDDIEDFLGKRIVYKGFVGRLIGVWCEQPSNCREISSIRTLNDWEELLPEMFSLYMLRPDLLAKRNRHLFHYTRRLLEYIVGEEVLPIVN